MNNLTTTSNSNLGDIIHTAQSLVSNWPLFTAVSHNITSLSQIICSGSNIENNDLSQQATFWKIQVFWKVILCQLVESCQCSEEECRLLSSGVRGPTRLHLHSLRSLLQVTGREDGDRKLLQNNSNFYQLKKYHIPEDESSSPLLNEPQGL